MLQLRPSASRLSRPSIQELSTFLLSPLSYSTRCQSRFVQYGHCHSRSISHDSHPIASRFHRNTARFRSFSTNPQTLLSAPKSHDRGPVSDEDTQTDFGALNVLGGTPAPSTSIDSCLWDGFHLNSGVKIVGGSGVLLVGGDAFAWRPWEARPATQGSAQDRLRLVNAKGQFEVNDEAWGLLSLVWPKPDLLILGLGKEMRPLSPRTRQYVNSLGIRIDIQDTRNAAAQFNLLATERGVGSVAAALVPLGWREGLGVTTGS